MTTRITRALLTVLLAPAAACAAGPATAPAPSALSRLAGKAVRIEHFVDVDGDGDRTEPETAYLRERLAAAGATVLRARDRATPLKAGDVLVLGQPADVPGLPKGEADPVATAMRERELAAVAAYRDGRAKAAADAKAAGVTVVDGDAATEFFGLAGDETMREVRRFPLTRAADALARKLVQVQFRDTDLAETLDFLRDVSGARLAISPAALKAAGATTATPVKLDLYNVSLAAALDALSAQLAPGKLTVVVGGDGTIELAAKPEAAERLAARPRAYLAPAELRDPPAEVIAPMPENVRPLHRKHLPALKIAHGLADVVEHLREQAGMKIEADWRALAEAGIERDEHVALATTASRSLGSVLGAVAAYVSADAGDHCAVFYLGTDGVIRLTSRRAAEKATDVAARVGW